MQLVALIVIRCPHLEPQLKKKMASSVQVSIDTPATDVSMLVPYITLTDVLFYSILVSNKALAGAKSIGSFLYSAVNKAGKTVSEASAKIKKTVEENVS